MFNRITTYALTLIIITTIGCAAGGSASKQTITGGWSGYAPDGNNLVLVFKDNKTVSITMGGYSFAGKYRLDQSTRPMILDITDFDDSQLTGSQYYAIVEFVTRDTLRMQGNFSGPGEKPRRPGSFTEERIDLKRSGH